MLAVILHVTLELLKDGPPDNRDSTLGGILANTLLKVPKPLPVYSISITLFILYCCYIIF